MATVRVETCQSCGRMTGEGQMYEHLQRHCPNRRAAATLLKRRALEEENAKYGPELRPISVTALRGLPGLGERAPVKAWRSATFLAMFFDHERAPRLTICRTAVTDAGAIADGITWDELMDQKRQAGYGHAWAVELFPPADHIVNVANLRHLWILEDGAPPFAWVRRRMSDLVE